MAITKAPGFSGLHDAFHRQEGNLSLTPQGNGRYELNADTLQPAAPQRASLKPLTPAQEASVKKAAATSAAKRKARAVNPGLG